MCEWCGDNHEADKLCQKAQRGVTRRSFMFMLGAGVTGLALAPTAASFPKVEVNYGGGWVQLPTSPMWICSGHVIHHNVLDVPVEHYIKSGNLFIPEKDV